MNRDKLKVILDHQTKLILNSIVSLEYLIKFPDYLKKINQEEPKDLWFIYNAIRDRTVINITQLFHGKEHYSFNVTRKILLEDFSKKDEIIKNFNLTMKPGNKIFRELNILDIRNQHVGHLLSFRENHTLNWEKVNELIKVGCDTHDYVNNIIFKKTNYWYLDQTLLHQIFTKDLKSREINSAWRKMYHNNEDNLSRDKIGELAKTNWP